MSVTELQSEIVALRAELDQYRSLIVANKGRESPSAEIGSYEALSESYMRELELTNAKLVHQLNTLTSEVKIHNTREVILMDELSKSMRDRDESVKALETQVETLQNEKQSVEGRVKGLEEELGELRELFQSLAASKSRSSSRMSSRSSGMTSVSRGRRSVRSGSDVDPIIPILSLENSSLWDKNSVRSSTRRVEAVGVVDGGGDVGLGGEMWESVFAEGEKLKGGNVLD
ncbi:hypothetical protein HDU99_007598 [Rhizoclosmatium hyalinum]|nr:hypothetical protein HDU99_007598 [Rhizoclosmatium hyalinum]